MKPRTVIITLEIQSDLALNILKDKDFWANEFGIEIVQARAQVAQAPKLIKQK